MSRFVPLILILVVMLTSIGLGAARGTIRMGEQIVLCTGHGVVVTRLPGDQGDSVHLCPDMALSVLAAVGPADIALPSRADRALSGWSIDSILLTPVRQAPVRVRDPPLVVRA